MADFSTIPENGLGGMSSNAWKESLLTSAIARRGIGVGLDEDVWWRQGCGGGVSGWCSLIRNGNICLLTQQMVSLLSADDKTPLSPGLDIHRQMSVFIDNDFRPDNGYNISYTPPRDHHYHASTGHLIYNIKIKGTGRVVKLSRIINLCLLHIWSKLLNS